MEAPEQTVLDFSTVPHVGGRAALSLSQGSGALRQLACISFDGEAVAAFDHEVWLWFFAGIVKQRWRDSRLRSVGKAVPAK